MSRQEPVVELIDSKDIEMFLPVMRDIDLGDRFLLSMLHWCGCGQRATSLELWRVFLVRHQNKIAGVCGIYRQPGTSPSISWVGWFGIRPDYRNRGLGTSAMTALIGIARNLGFKELWVYTGESDQVAVRFYQTLGFEILGRAAEFARGRTIEDSDVVLRRSLVTEDFQTVPTTASDRKERGGR